MFDVIWTALVVHLCAFLIFGSYSKSSSVKFYRWETFGTAFDPPIPCDHPTDHFDRHRAVDRAMQAVAEPDQRLECRTGDPHSAADDIDEEELEALKKAVGDQGVGDTDVTRGSIQGNQTKGQD